MAFNGLPILAGVTLRRPRSATKTPESNRRSLQLASGSLRVYDGGVRDVFELAWGKLTEGELAALEAAAAAPMATYTHLDGTTRVVETSPPSSTPLPGTDPVRFEASITLRARDVTR